jgi:hypothetical protein
MSMSLRGARGHLDFNIVAWGEVLRLAQQYGWEPAGTEAPDVQVRDEKGNIDREMTAQYTWAPDDWDAANYFTNDFQRVTDQDAASIADALERGLDDIPDFDTGEKTREYTPDDPPAHPTIRALVEAGMGPVIGPDDSLSPAEFFSGHGKQKVKDFVAFCRAGGFLIT